jgi:hypothetical protein
MYRHVTSSITSSAVRASRAEEVSATSAVRGGPETPTDGEGSNASTAGRRPAVIVTWAGSDAGAITTLWLSDDGGGAESSSKTTTPVLAAWAGLGRRFLGRLSGGCLHGHLTLLNGGGRDWWWWRDQCSRLGDNRQLLLSMRWRQLRARGLWVELRRNHPCAQCQALQTPQAEHA